MKLTPLHLSLLIHVYTTPAPIPNADNGTHRKFLDDLQDHGLIDVNGDGREGSGWAVTTKGKAHMAQLLSLPLPVQVWTDANGEIIEL